jgi:biopolymer transport protein TolR
VLACPILHLGDDGDGILYSGDSGGKGLSAEINVTPLIDVLLVLLIIFMVIVPVMPRGLNSSLPSTTAAERPSSAAEGSILVEVEQGDAAVHYCVNGIGLERAEVGPRLQELLARRSVRQVLLRADARPVVAGVIDAGQAAGADSIALLTSGSDTVRR